MGIRATQGARFVQISLFYMIFRAKDNARAGHASWPTTTTSALAWPRMIVTWLESVHPIGRHQQRPTERKNGKQMQDLAEETKTEAEK